MGLGADCCWNSKIVIKSWNRLNHCWFCSFHGIFSEDITRLILDLNLNEIFFLASCRQHNKLETQHAGECVRCVKHAFACLNLLNTLFALFCSPPVPKNHTQCRTTVHQLLINFVCHLGRCRSHTAGLSDLFFPSAESSCGWTLC